jgi:hypothetical protein
MNMDLKYSIVPAGPDPRHLDRPVGPGTLPLPLCQHGHKEHLDT